MIYPCSSGGICFWFINIWSSGFLPLIKPNTQLNWWVLYEIWYSRKREKWVPFLIFSDIQTHGTHKRHRIILGTIYFYYVSLLSNFFKGGKWIYQWSRCLPGSYTSCKLYIHLHPAAKTWFHPTTECLSAIQSWVKSRSRRSALWQHLHLISSHKMGDLSLPTLKFFESQCITILDSLWLQATAFVNLFFPSFTDVWDRRCLWKLKFGFQCSLLCSDSPPHLKF